MKYICMLVGLVVISPFVMAEVVKSTETVQGSAPQALNLKVENMTNPGAEKLKKNDVIKGTYSFLDPDGDVEFGTELQWSYEDNTPIPGVSGDTYKVTSDDAGHHIKFLVIPKTDSSITDPDVGAVTMSEGLFVDEPFIPSDIIRIDKGTGWAGNDSTSGSYRVCAELGARMLTTAELQKLYLDMTTAETIPSTPNTEVCGVWGWALSGMCGGSTYQDAADYYWVSESASGVNMRTGVTKVLVAGQSVHRLVCKRL